MHIINELLGSKRKEREGNGLLTLWDNMTSRHWSTLMRIVTITYRERERERERGGGERTQEQSLKCNKIVNRIIKTFKVLQNKFQ